MKVKVEYTIYKTMEIEVPKVLSETYYKMKKEKPYSFAFDEAYDNISEFVGAYVKAEEGYDNVDCVIDWDEMED